MIPYSLTQFNHRTVIENRIKELTKYYSAAQKGVKAKLLSIDLTAYERYRLKKTMTEVNQIIKGLNGVAYDWAKVSIPYSYNLGVQLTGDKLKTFKDITKIEFNAPIHKSAVNILADNTSIDLISANNTMMRNVDRFLLMTQQRLLEDKAITDMIADGIIQGEARRTVSDNILNAFRKRMGEEQFIVINGRNYRPDYYSEMVARTRTSEAVNQAAVNTSLYYENDLMQISIHSDACEDCEAIQGRIYSISGTHPDFPSIAGIELPLHPHCRHYLIPVDADILKERGEYDKLSNLSRSSQKVKTFNDYEERVKV